MSSPILQALQRTQNGFTFPAGQTIIKPFEFNLGEIPKGINYYVEVVYSNGYSKRVCH
ncbi:MAG: hypothetical protein AB7V56_06880 [Candidatus Nitrosocosmicus sp.]